MPKKTDASLSYFMVSPDMHKGHHHFVLPYTDSNYGNMFSVWDWLFGTFMTLPREKNIFGIDTHLKSEEHNNPASLLKILFKK